MVTEVKWIPRGEAVILEGVLNAEVANRKVEVTDADGNHYVDDYDWFIYDKGPEVDHNLETGDEVYLNHANIRMFDGKISDRKKKRTFAYISSEVLITFHRPGPVQI